MLAECAKMGLQHALIPGSAMKHLSLYLTVLLLGGVPPSAAALDYGSNSALLAADTNAPQLPGAAMHDAARGEMSKPDVMAVDANTADDTADAGEVVPTQAPQRMAPSASSPRAAPAPRASSNSASNKPRMPAAHPTPVPATASWQSLLPGSIQ